MSAQVTETGLTTETRILNMGPQHPSTHGVLRLLLTLDGEVILDAKPDIGYLHRASEWIGEHRAYPEFIPYCDRMDYVAGLGNNLAYCVAVERLMGLEVPPKAKFIRTLMSELQRLASHLVWLGTYGLDLGATTVFLYAFREREKLLDLIEAVTGARLTISWFRIGGVPEELPSGFDSKIREFLKYMPSRIDEYDRLFTFNRIFIARTKGIGLLPPQVGLSYGASGPTIRGSGVPFDIRKYEPYDAYDQIDFEVPTQPTCDAYGRYLVRIAEMRQSLRIVEQALEGMPEGPVMAKVRRYQPPPGEAYGRIESPRGDYGMYVVSDGTERPLRLRVRTPSFANLSALPEMVKGHKVADVVAILGSIDIVLGEVDR